MELLKNICESCCVPIAMTVNLSLEQGIVPDGMKLAKVIPVYKAKSRDTFTNYRPISLLSNISKILEKVVHKRLYSFITKHEILYISFIRIQHTHMIHVHLIQYNTIQP